MKKLLQRIKKALATSTKSKQELRQANNRWQVKLILQGFEERGY